MKFNRELYSKTALIKAAYNFTDRAYVHLDADDKYYYVEISPKNDMTEISEREFTNEILAQSVRHVIYRQTKNIRELLLARAMASSVVIDDPEEHVTESAYELFTEDEILRDWFSTNEES